MWTTRVSDRDRNYVVIKHSMPNINLIVMGVKFRQSYAVVEKDSKIYHQLKKFPFLQNAKEFPLTFLSKLKFITRPLDVQTVYGVDVYSKYKKAMAAESEAKEQKEKADKELAHLADNTKCHYRYSENPVNKGQLCQKDAVKESPSKYCLKHILEDKELNIPQPLPILKEDKKKLALKIVKNIENYTKRD